MLLCKICNVSFSRREEFAGHNSGHVRRGEKPKLTRSAKVYPRKCDKCDYIIAGPRSLGGHQQKHLRSLEDLRCDGSRKGRLLLKRGHICEGCSLTEWCDESIPLELDHIDGDPDNNVESNLRLLCPNCHAQQPTHKGRNKGRHSAMRNVVRMSYPNYRHHL